jgi:hypothetical protein
MKLMHVGKVMSSCLPTHVFHSQNYSLHLHVVVAFSAKSSGLNSFPPPPLFLMSSMFIFFLLVQCNLTLLEDLLRVQHLSEEQLRKIHYLLNAFYLEYTSS